MKIEDIIKQVRWCIDEESNNTSAITDEKDDLYMDNIIKSKINDALHWIAITAASSSVFAESKKTSDTSLKISVDDYEATKNIGIITMDENTEIISISRVRGKEWFKAVIPVEDTDNEAYMMFDESAMGTADRPQATIMRENPIKILLQPKPTEAVVSFVGVPKNVDVSSAVSYTHLTLPTRYSV